MAGRADAVSGVGGYILPGWPFPCRPATASGSNYSRGFGVLSEDVSRLYRTTSQCPNRMGVQQDACFRSKHRKCEPVSESQLWFKAQFSALLP